jgi:hypothetical protein
MNGWVAHTAAMAHHDSITCVGAATTTATDTAIGAGIGCWHWGGCEAGVQLAHLNVVFRHVCVVSWLHRAAGHSSTTSPSPTASPGMFTSLHFTHLSIVWCSPAPGPGHTQPRLLAGRGSDERGQVTGGAVAVVADLPVTPSRRNPRAPHGAFVRGQHEKM